MGREVRRVPADWKHPKNQFGNYIPLYGCSISKRQAEWDEGQRQWDAGFRTDYSGGWKLREADETCSFEEWDGKRPMPEDYMPDWTDAERTHYQMYEDTSEGTPISPVMETPEELARWLVDNRASAFAGDTASYEAWLVVCKGKSTFGFIMTSAGQMINGVEAVGLS